MVDVDSESHHFKFKKDGANWKGKVQNLKDLCLDVLMKNRKQLRKVGKAPYWLMKPIYDKLEPDELEELEKLNPGLKADTMELWKKHCVVRFPDDYSNYNVQDWRELFFMQKVEEAQRLVRARERLRKSTQEDKKRRKVKLISPLNLPPVQRTYGGWVKLTPLQKVLKKTLRSGAYEHRTHFTQLESGPTMMTVPADWLRGPRDSNPHSTSSSSTMGGPSHRIPAQVALPSKYLPTNTNACKERRRETKFSLVNNRESSRSCQFQAPSNRSTASNSFHLHSSTRRSTMTTSTAIPPPNISPASTLAACTSSSKRSREAEATALVAKRVRSESFSDIHSTRVHNSTRLSIRQANATHSGSQRVTSSISRPQKVSDSSFPRTEAVSKQSPAGANKLTATLARSGVFASKKMTSKSGGTVKLPASSKVVKSPSITSVKLGKAIETADNNAGKILSIKKDVRHEPYRTKKRSIVRDEC